MPASSPTVSFPKKLLLMITEAKGEGISWDFDGTSFSVTDRSKVIAMLPKYFKHKSWNSLTRQLNIYGFDPIKSKRKGLGSVTTFRHPLFTKGIQNPDAIKRIINKHEKENSGSHHDESDHSNPSTLNQTDKIFRLEQELRDLKVLNQKLEFRLEDSKAKFNDLAKIMANSFTNSNSLPKPSTIDTSRRIPNLQASTPFQPYPQESLALRPLLQDHRNEDLELPPLRMLFPSAF